MKTLSLGLLLFVSGFFLVSCNKKDKVIPALSADKTAVNATAQAGIDYLQISSNTDWTISGIPSWLTVTPASGKGDMRVELSFPANTSTEALSATLTLSGTDVSPNTISFTQMGSAPSLLADKTTADEKAEGQTDSLVITSNVPWKLEIPTAAAWITTDKTTGPAGVTKVFLTIHANENGRTRSANLSLVSTSTTITPITIVINQLQPEVLITSFTDHAKGGETITINGSGFSDIITENTVKINNKTAAVTAATATSLSVVVPMQAGDGKVNLKVAAKTTTTTNNFFYDWVGVVTTFAGDGSYNNLWGVSDVVTDQAGNVYVTESQNHTIRKYSPNGSYIILAGRYRGFGDAKGENASFNVPFGLAIDANGNLFVADKDNHAIRKVSPDGTVTTIAGKGSPGAANGNSANASFNHPTGLTVDGNGNIYVADQDNHMIRKIATDGTVTTLAGSLTRGAADGVGAAAGFYYPSGITIDGGGNLFVADYYNHRIRKISPDGTVTTIAGSSYGYFDGQGTSARFQYPAGLAVDGQGNIYVADRDNYRIRKISATGRVITLAGDVNGFADGTGSQALFFLPREITVDANGTLYVADETNYRIRKIIQQ